jgi:Palmitoyl protein thioesterase
MRVYLSTSFLPDINNVININETYRYNLSRLQKLVLIDFKLDQISARFGSMTQDGSVVQSPVYTALELDVLDSSGRLRFVTIIGGGHMQSSSDNRRQLINRYFT